MGAMGEIIESPLVNIDDASDGSVSLNSSFEVTAKKLPMDPLIEKDDNFERPSGSPQQKHKGMN